MPRTSDPHKQVLSTARWTCYSPIAATAVRSGPFYRFPSLCKSTPLTRCHSPLFFKSLLFVVSRFRSSGHSDSISVFLHPLVLDCRGIRRWFRSLVFLFHHFFWLSPCPKIQRSDFCWLRFLFLSYLCDTHCVLIRHLFLFYSHFATQNFCLAHRPTTDPPRPVLPPPPIFRSLLLRKGEYYPCLRSQPHCLPIP